MRPPRFENTGPQQSAQRQALDVEAALLHSDALRERLAQGKDEPFIAGLFAAQEVGEVADYLVQGLGGEMREETDPIQLLTRYLG